jgi:hypothetical protein
VRHRAGRTVPEQDAAFSHEDVVALVAEIVAAQDLRLVKLAARVSMMRHELSPDDRYSLIGPVLFNDDDLGNRAQEVALRANKIGSAPSRDARVRRRGAFLERLVHELVGGRRANATYREREVELTHNPRSRRQWTHPKEVVVDDNPFEVFECKADGMVDVGDIDQLSDIATTARAEGTDPRATVVTLDSEAQLRRMAVAWRLTETIHGVPIERILGLADDPPDRPIVPAA